ncbi:unnamed protein product [Caenorhabditis sp. 36 PRJEB53466]|nr:unnamed protein product [Caenorhabditis sp. 36 PRJEB53466]
MAPKKPGSWRTKKKMKLEDELKSLQNELSDTKEKIQKEEAKKKEIQAKKRKSDAEFRHKKQQEFETKYAAELDANEIEIEELSDKYDNFVELEEQTKDTTVKYLGKIDEALEKTKFHENMMRKFAKNPNHTGASCPVCSNEYHTIRIPRVLTCGHTICELCIRKIDNEENNNNDTLGDVRCCPTCRVQFEHKSGEEWNLPPNYALL